MRMHQEADAKEEIKDEMPQLFGHYTYEASKGLLMLVDI